jgi:putative transcriptional regulator
MSTKSLLEALSGPRVRIQAVDRVTSGSAASFRLQRLKGFERTVDVARALARRGVRLSVAKRAVERMLDGHAAGVHVPHVEDNAAFIAELGALRVKADPVRNPTGDDLANLRARLSLTQEQFANTYMLELRTLQNWEQGRRKALDPQASLLVKALDRYPDLMERVAVDE